MRWKIALAILIMAAAGYFFAAPYFMSEEKDLTAGKSPAEILHSVEEKGSELENFKYHSEVSMGDTISIALTSKIIPSAKKEYITFSWKASQGYGEASMYIDGQKIYIYHPLKAKWFTPNEIPGVSQLAQMFARQLELLNPYRSLEKIEPDKVKIEKTGKEKVDGIETAVLEVSPGATANKWFEGVLPPQLVGAKIAEVKQIYWIGTKDLLIHKYLMKADIKILGLPGMDFRAQTNNEDFNKTEIKIPSKLSNKMK